MKNCLSVWNMLYLTNLRFIENILTSCILSLCLHPELDVLGTLGCTVSPRWADMNGIFFCSRAGCSNEFTSL